MEKRGVGGDKSGKRGYDPEEDGGEFEKEETVICVLAERLHCLTGRRERVKSHTASLFLLVFFFLPSYMQCSHIRIFKYKI